MDSGSAMTNRRFDSKPILSSQLLDLASLTQTVRVIIRPRRCRSAAAYIVVKLSRGRSVGRCVGACVCLSVHRIVENGGSDPDAVWRHRLDASRDEAGSGVWRSVHGNGYVRIWGAPL